MISFGNIPIELSLRNLFKIVVNFSAEAVKVRINVEK